MYIFYKISFKHLLCLIISLSFLLQIDRSYAGSIVAKEYQLKAVFLYNFVYFVRWPRSAFRSYQNSFNICVLGEDPFGEELDLAVENETVNRRIVKILRFQDIRNVGSCQILFVSKSEQDQLSRILAYLEQRPILTVSDITNFSYQGGMIEFFKSRNRLRLSIAYKKVKNTKLRISANLLHIARLVHK
jgi:hypothetical protein